MEQVKTLRIHADLKPKKPLVLASMCVYLVNTRGQRGASDKERNVDLTVELFNFRGHASTTNGLCASGRMRSCVSWH